ncbi:MAPEG family protein [Pseudomonas reactans]
MSDLLHVYVLCVLVLCLKMFAISAYQGVFRLRLKAFTNPEDARFFDRATHGEELPQVTRAAKAWRNDLENIPLFFVLGGLCVALETSNVATRGMFCAFVIARVLHTLAYLARWQPWRTVAYGGGVACLFGLGGMLIWRLA